MASGFEGIGRLSGRFAVQKNLKGTGKKPSKLLFAGLAVFALLKDMLDFVGIGSLPLIGLVVTGCFSLIIFIMLLVFDRSGGAGNKRILQGIVITSATIIEGFGFIFNFLPIETLTVLFLYHLSYKSWKEAQKG